jgi:hypothetical protein
MSKRSKRQNRKQHSTADKMAQRIEREIADRHEIVDWLLEWYEYHLRHNDPDNAVAAFDWAEAMEAAPISTFNQGLYRLVEMYYGISRYQTVLL